MRKIKYCAFCAQLIESLSIPRMMPRSNGEPSLLYFHPSCYQPWRDRMEESERQLREAGIFD